MDCFCNYYPLLHQPYSARSVAAVPAAVRCAATSAEQTDPESRARPQAHKRREPTRSEHAAPEAA